MRHYPVFIDLRGRRVVVAGAGEVAVAKLRLLLKTEAALVVYGTDPAPELLAWAAEGRIALVARDHYRTIVDVRIPPVPSVTMSLNETRDVSVNIDSPEAFMDVEVRVLLAGGIELEGLRGRREVKWKTDLEPGINRLTLPIVALDDSGGKILVAVGQGEKRRTFVVQINVDGTAVGTQI